MQVHNFSFHENETIWTYIDRDQNVSVTIQNSTQLISCSVFNEYPPELMDFAAVSFTLFSIFGIFGNFISIWALAKCKRLRNATTAFIINLSAADLLLSAFTMPMSALSFFERGWSYGELLCVLFPLIRYSNFAVSLESFIAITVNRYILVVHPTIYQKVYSTANVVIMITVMWLSTSLTWIFPLFKIWGEFGYDPKVGTCTILPLNGKSPKTLYYILGFILPSFTFVFCYSRIYCVVHRASEAIRKSSMPMRASRGVSFIARRGWLSKSYRHSEMHSQEIRACSSIMTIDKKENRKDLKILKVMIVIFITFVLTFFPVSFVKILRKENDLPIMNVFGYLGVYFSSIINPVIYIVMSREYRKAYAELFYQKSSDRFSSFPKKRYLM